MRALILAAPTVLLADNPITIPDPVAPGGIDTIVSTILGWLRWGIFAAGVIGLLVGLIMLVSGSMSNNPQSATLGKRALVVSGIVLLAAGLLPTLMTSITA